MYRKNCAELLKWSNLFKVQIQLQQKWFVKSNPGKEFEPAPNIIFPFFVERWDCWTKTFLMIKG
jgi:hypothetical protein